MAEAAALLHAFGADVHTPTVRQLSGRTAIPRSTVHVLAATLCEAALLEEVCTARATASAPGWSGSAARSSTAPAS